MTVPLLIDRIGAERFGLLALAWGLVGYAGILDLGIGRAVTRRVAELRMTAGDAEILNVLRSGLSVTKVAGLAGCLALMLAAFSGVHRAIPLSNIQADEILYSMMLLALALPIQAMSATYRGVNEAYSNFVGISVLRIMLGAANFGGPFMVSLWSTDLAWLVSTIVLSRLVGLYAYRTLALRCLPYRAETGLADRATMVGLLRFGGWVSVSNAISPVLVQADRFFIGVLISASAVTAYVLPYEIVMQCLVLVGAVTTVIFPAMSGAVAEDRLRAREIYAVWLWRVGLGMLAVTVALSVSLPWILDTWLGSRVSDDSLLVGRILCAGVFLNSVGAVCFAYLHANGRVRATAIAHIVEVPLFLGVLYLAVTEIGIVGAAVAWVVRVALDTGLLLWLVSSLHAETRAT